MRTTKRLARGVLAVVCLAAMIVTALALARRWSLPKPRHFTAIECTPATGEVVSVGWVERSHRWGRAPSGGGWGSRKIDLDGFLSRGGERADKGQAKLRV